MLIDYTGIKVLIYFCGIKNHKNNWNMKRQVIMWLTTIIVAVATVGCGQKTPQKTKEWKTDEDFVEVSAIESDGYVENDSCKGFAYLEVDTSAFNRMALIIPIDTLKKEVPDFTGFYNLGNYNLSVNGKHYKAFCTYGYDFIPPFALSYLFIYEGGLHDKVSLPSGDIIRVKIERENKTIYSFDFYPTSSTSTP